ncbi:hypothetical protein ALON55S_03321 [Alishewanella longhuensis]
MSQSVGALASAQAFEVMGAVMAKKNNRILTGSNDQYVGTVCHAKC